VSGASSTAPRSTRDAGRARRRAGLSSVEVSILVCLAGIVLAVGIPAFVRALHTSKLAEAPRELQRIYAAASAYYAMAHATAEGEQRHCLPESAGPSPGQPSRGPVAVQFAAAETSGAASWRALGYEPEGPIRFRYSLRVGHPGCGGRRDSHGEFVLSAQAEGDLDGDGVLSTFERNASVKNGELELDPLLTVRDAVE
jgi:type IV pilus assembly protein PilA